jgi:hypothetical protein
VLFWDFFEEIPAIAQMAGRIRMVMWRENPRHSVQRPVIAAPVGGKVDLQLAHGSQTMTPFHWIAALDGL